MQGGVPGHCCKGDMHYSHAAVSLLAERVACIKLEQLQARRAGGGDNKMGAGVAVAVA